MSDAWLRSASVRVRRRTDLVGLTLLAGLAFLARLGLLLASPGGLLGNVGDDSAAYYSGADALVHGRLPYRDFVLLHPPVLDLVLTPFALVGELSTDHTGYVLATLAFEMLGALNTVLVVLTCRRIGLSRAAGGAAGLFYALWFGAIGPDSAVRLETLQTTLTLLALLVLLRRPGGTVRRRDDLLAGAALGVGAAVKIWGVLTLVVVLAVLLAARATRARVTPVLGGAVAGAALTLGPFFLLSPVAMWRMVVADQLTRNPDHTQVASRLTLIDQVFPDAGTATRAGLLAVTLAALALVIAAAWTVPLARLPVLLTLAHSALLLVSPVFFPWYTGLLAGPLAVSVGAAFDMRSRRDTRSHACRSGRVIGAVALITAVVVTVGGFVTVPAILRSEPFPTESLTRLLGGTHCPTPDGPMVLIQSNTLSSTLAAGCPNWIDVSGRVYDVDKSPYGAGYPRTLNLRWQRDLRQYLLGGDLVIIFRPGLGIGPDLRDRLKRLPLLLDRDGVQVYRVRPSR